MQCLFGGVSFSSLVPREQACEGRRGAAPAASELHVQAAEPSTHNKRRCKLPPLHLTTEMLRQVHRGERENHRRLFDFAFKIKACALTLTFCACLQWFTVMMWTVSNYRSYTLLTLMNRKKISIHMKTKLMRCDSFWIRPVFLQSLDNILPDIHKALKKKTT